MNRINHSLLRIWSKAQDLADEDILSFILGLN